MLIGLALTRHCNLRCAHCIRRDVTSVRTLDPRLIRSILDQARDLFGPVRVSLTGGEPLLHPSFGEIVEDLSAGGVPYRFTTNGWHMRRWFACLDRHPPESVRLSLSGGSEETHDAERGHGSWRRLMEATALCTLREIPFHLSFIVDRRTRHEIRTIADLAEDLGCLSLGYILPQPVPASAARNSDLPPSEWLPVRREVESLAGMAHRRTGLRVDYGAPFEGPETLCDTFKLQQFYVDPEGRLCTCCQLSEYGNNDVEVVADLFETPLEEAWRTYVARLAHQRRESRSTSPADPLGEFPCLRCARSCGKLEWLKSFPGNPWNTAPEGAEHVEQIAVAAQA